MRMQRQTPMLRALLHSNLGIMRNDRHPAGIFAQVEIR